MKRQRGENFTADECSLLVHHMEAFGATIESKKTDKFSQKQKEESWDKLVKAFNEDSGRPKEKLALKNLWKRLKQDAKKKIRDYNQQMDGTAEGTPVEPPSVLYLRIAELITSQFVALPNRFDSDRPTPAPSNGAASPSQTICPIPNVLFCIPPDIKEEADDSDDEVVPEKKPREEPTYQEQKQEILFLQREVLAKQLEAFEAQKQAYLAMEQFYKRRSESPKEEQREDE